MEVNTTILQGNHCVFFDLTQYLKLDLDDFFTSSCIVVSLLMTPTVLLNALVLAGIYKTPSLHTPSNVLLCGLALTDLGAGLLGKSTYVIIGIAYIWKLDRLWCDMNLLSYLLAVPFPVLSYVTIALVSLERVIALKYHMRYNTIVNNKRVLITLVFFWILTFLVSSSYFWFSQLMLWSTVIALSVCLTICPVNNLLIFRILRRHRIDIQRQHEQIQINTVNMAQRRKTSINMLWVYLLFILCYAPFLVIKLHSLIQNNYSIEKRSYIALCSSYIFIYLNSLLNPLFYCIKMRKVRRAVIKMLPEKFVSLRLSAAGATTNAM